MSRFTPDTSAAMVDRPPPAVDFVHVSPHSAILVEMGTYSLVRLMRPSPAVTSAAQASPHSVALVAMATFSLVRLMRPSPVVTSTVVHA